MDRPIERPKKTKTILFWKKEKAQHYIFITYFEKYYIYNNSLQNSYSTQEFQSELKITEYIKEFKLLLPEAQLVLQVIVPL